MTRLVFLVIYDRHAEREGKKKFVLVNLLLREWATMNMQIDNMQEVP